MKKHLIRISMIAALAVTGSYAQNRPILQVNVPFDFVAGKMTYPAGEYTVSLANSARVLSIESSDHRSYFLGLAMDTRSPNIQNQGRLVFHRYGDSYILSEMWVTGSADGFRLEKTALERELIAKSASSGTTTVATR